MLKFLEKEQEKKSRIEFSTKTNKAQQKYSVKVALFSLQYLLIFQTLETSSSLIWANWHETSLA